MYTIQELKKVRASLGLPENADPATYTPSEEIQRELMQKARAKYGLEALPEPDKSA